MSESVETAKSIYDRLAAEREPYVQRAERCALVTIPSLFPKAGHNGSSEFVTPQTSIGARGVNNLAAKIMLATMPPNMPFMRLDVANHLKQEALRMGAQDQLDQIQYALSQEEKEIMKYMATKQYRPTLTEGSKQLIVAGNVCYFQPPAEGGIKAYRLHNYVVKRDGLGKPYLILTVDHFSYAGLPQNLKALADTSGQQHKPEDVVDIYTHAYLEEGTWFSYQELDGKRIPDTDQKFPPHLLPWTPVRLVKVEGEDYGRGYVEEYLGDLESVEAIQKAILGYAGVASRIIHLVRPNGTTKVRAVQKAQTGDFVTGDRDDISTLNLDKAQDFQTIKEIQRDLKSDLSFAFLLNNAVQRQAERVTAEEIRYVARELEETLGGFYSLLSEDLQLPLVNCVMNQMTRAGLLPDLPPGTVVPSIITGVEALGRGHDLDNINQFLEYLTRIPEASRYMKLGGLLKQVATSLALDVSGLIFSDAEVQQKMQQEQQQMLVQNAAPQLVQGAMKGATA